MYSGIGAFFTWLIYLIVHAIYPSNFIATLIGAVFVGNYAFIMSRINKAPATIFLAASAFPLVPGAHLYYMMYGCVSKDINMAFKETLIILTTCLAIAFGFIIVDVVTRCVMQALKVDYHVGKERSQES